MTFTLKSALVAAFVSAAGLAGSLGAAHAGGKVGVWFGPHVGVGVGGIGVGIGVGVGPTYGHYHGHDHGRCSKADALGRAAALGVRKRHVSHVGGHSIVVRGLKKGHAVRVTMARNSRNCAVRSLDYI
jgi:hypothetical protein